MGSRSKDKGTVFAIILGIGKWCRQQSSQSHKQHLWGKQKAEIKVRVYNSLLFFAMKLSNVELTIHFAHSAK